MVRGVWEDEQPADVNAFFLVEVCFPGKRRGTQQPANRVGKICYMSYSSHFLPDQFFHYEDQVAMTRGS